MKIRTHFRVCHMCGSLNTADGDLVTACEGCGKHLAPFYFFDESRAMGLNTLVLSSNESEPETTLPHKEYPPVWGLTAYWE
ncbi:hypothetical protein D3C87_162230 [compost metagenome]